MKNREEINKLLHSFRSSVDRPVQVNEEAIAAAYQHNEGNQPLVVKILSVCGGVLSSLAFLGFLIISRLYESETGLLLSGGILIAGSVWLNKVSGKIITDTISVSSFIIGFFLLGFGLSEMKVGGDGINLLFILIASATLAIAHTFILSVVSVLILNGCVLSLIISNKVYDLVNVQVSALALALTYISLKEAMIITSNRVLCKLFSPVRTGLMFAFLACLFCLGKQGVLPVLQKYVWCSSVVIMVMIVYLASRLLKIFSIHEARHRASVYAFIVLLLLPTVFSPAITGALLLILLSYQAHYRTGFASGIIFFIYFICQYYYDLSFTLLTKSILLFLTGILFIALFVLTYKSLTTDEKV